MKRLTFLFLLIFGIVICVQSQVTTQNARRLRSGAASPNSPALPCVVGPPYTDIYIRTSDHSEWQCTGASTWTQVVSGGTPGSVTTVSVVSANGQSGSVANPTTTPAITLNNPTALNATTSIQSPFFVSAAPDPADAGAIRLGNNEFIEWEKATPGTDWTLGVNPSDVLITNAPFQALTFNKITITQPASGATLTIPDGVTLNAGAGGTLGSNAFNSTSFEATANKDATGGYAGLTLFKINFKNAANTFTSFFTNANSAARTYTFQNRDGTIADDTDLATKQNTITFGTGVQTALGVNVGSAGAPVLFNGAGGTPSSLTGTNISGTAASLTAGTATNATNTGITDDTSTNATVYPTWVTAATGNLPQKVSSTRFTFNPSTGVVGINHAAPSVRFGQKLDLSTSATYGGMSLNTWSASQFFSLLDLTASGSDTIGTHAVVTNGQELGRVSFQGSDGAAFQDAAAIRAFVDAAPGTNDMPGRLGLYTTADGATTLTERMRITNSGAIFMYNLATDAAATDVTVCKISATSQIVTGTGTLGICLGTSSERFKNNLHPLGSALDRILALTPQSYFYNADHGDGGRRIQYGLTAEQAGKAFPELVGYDQDGKPNTFDMLGTYPWAIQAIKEMQIEIQSLRSEVKTLKERP